MSGAIVLLSGGLDSATCLSFANTSEEKIVALSFDYGQRHKKELDAAKKIVEYYNSRRKIMAQELIEHIIVPMDLKVKSALTDAKIKMPPFVEHIVLPTSWVPGRNVVFLAIASGIAESMAINKIYIGTNQVDYSGYPDCTQNFITAMQKAIQLGVDHRIKIITPLQNMTKAGIIQTARAMHVPIEVTWSCYEGGDEPCGKCPSCVIRAKAFEEVGVIDAGRGTSGQ